MGPGPSGRGSGQPCRVAVGDQVVEARRGIVGATGTHAAIPPIPGLGRVPYWTNREAIEAKELPSSLLVLGGGAVGAELAQVFARFGVEVTVVEALERLVPGDEPQAGELLADVFASEGIAVHTAANVTDVRRDDAQVTVELADGTTLPAAQILVATGRRADLAAAGLGAVGVAESKTWVPVDDHLGVTDRHRSVVATAAATAWAKAPAPVWGNSSSTTSARLATVAIAIRCIGRPVGCELLAEPAEADQGGLGQHGHLAGERRLDLAVDAGFEAASPAVLEVLGDLGGGVLVCVAVEVTLEELADLAAREGPVGNGVAAPRAHL
jgi:hypothetical protein